MELQLPLWLSLPLAAFLWCGVLIVLLSFMKAWLELRTSWKDRILTDSQRASFLIYAENMAAQYAIEEELRKIKDERK